jgi:hypothetical protein
MFLNPDYISKESSGFIYLLATLLNLPTSRCMVLYLLGRGRRLTDSVVFILVAISYVDVSHC